jgi:integrase
VKVDGHQYTRAVDVTTVREAKAMLPQFIVDIKNGAVAAARAERERVQSAPTFEEACQSFVESELSTDPLDSTRQAYFHSLQLLGRNGLNGRKVAEVRPLHVREAMLAVNRQSALATTKLAHLTLGRLFKSLIHREVLTSSPVGTLSSLELPPPGRLTKERGALTPEQVRDLLQAASDDDQLHLWISLMLATACRPGEATAVRFGSIDWIRGSLKIDAAVKPGASYSETRLGPTKGRRSRMVPLGPAIMRMLERARVERESIYQRLGLTLQDGDFLFPSDIVGEGRTAPRAAKSLSAHFKKAARAAGLKGVSPHWLRHTSLTRALAGDAVRPGISVSDVAAFAGHRDATMISKVYGHAISENIARGAALADSLLLPPPAVEIDEASTQKVAS